MGMGTYTGTAAGLVAGVIGAACDVAVAFGGHVTQNERTALIGLGTALVAVGPLAGAAIDHLRHRVRTTPVVAG